jgi:hypothetical protein
MSAPYGQPPAAPQPGSSPSPSRGGGLNLGGILALAALGLGLIIYLCNFSADALGFSSPLLYFFLVAALLGAGTLLPKSPAVLVPAAVLAAAGTLGMLNAVVLADPPSIVIVILVLGLLQTAALVGAVLVDAGMIKMKPKQTPSPGQQWGPPSGSFPAQPGPFPPNQYGQSPAGQYGQGQPGQYGQPSQQSPPNQYESDMTQQFSQPWGGEPWKGGGYGHPGEQPRRGEGEPGQREPGQQGPNPPFGQPGTPPGGERGPDRS